jgi:hypothetical protein
MPTGRMISIPVTMTGLLPGSGEGFDAVIVSVHV